MHFQFIQHVVKRLDGASQDGRISWVKKETVFLEQFTTLLCLIDSCWGKSDITPACPSALLVPEALTVTDDDQFTDLGERVFDSDRRQGH